MKKFFSLIIATWFGSGLIPPILLKGMAGTYGSFFSIPLCYLALYLSLSTQNLWPLFVITFVIYMLGLLVVPTAETELGPRTDWKGKTKTRDQNQIVIDETFGMLITCIPIYFFHDISYWWSLFIAFGLFRLFDIVKIWPTKYFDRQKTANGVMLDDGMAGIYGAISLYFILKYLF